MKIVLILITLAAAFNTEASDILLDDSKVGLSDKFAIFKGRFKKTYSNSDEAAAFFAFSANDHIIQKHNAGNWSFTLGHNEFSDLTWKQFKAIYVGRYLSDAYLNRPKSYGPSLLDPNAKYADSLDWVDEGAVNPVRNQGQCGACWAFSAAAAVEGAYQIAGNTLAEFSVQDLVSCDNKKHGGSNLGCDGGVVDNAFNWISKHGICLEQDYPYTAGEGKQGKCIKTCKPVATLTGYYDVPAESHMVAAISVGPVSVAIEADKSIFQLYKHGVFDHSLRCGTQLDHGVLLVGYGSTARKNYYKLRNSWGPSWGESGYMRLVRDKDMCGVAQQASYPTGVRAM